MLKAFSKKRRKATSVFLLIRHLCKLEQNIYRTRTVSPTLSNLGLYGIENLDTIGGGLLIRLGRDICCLLARGEGLGKLAAAGGNVFVFVFYFADIDEAHATS